MIDLKKIKPIRVRGRMLLLLPLAGLLALGGVLIIHAPDDSSRGTAGTWLSGNKRYAVFYDEWFRTKPRRTEITATTVDLASGHAESMDIPLGNMIAAAIDSDSNVFLLQQPLDAANASLKRDTMQIVFLDFSSRQVRVDITPGFPEPDHSRLAGDRYWIAVNKGLIYVLDTKSKGFEVRSFPASTNSKYVMGMRESNRFVLIDGRPNQAIQAGAFLPIALYEIDSNGEPALVNAWPAGLINGWTEVDSDESRIYSFSPDLTQVEISSARNGAFESSLSVPGVTRFDSGSFIHQQILVSSTTSGDPLFFDLQTKLLLPDPGSGYRLSDISPDRRYVFFSRMDDDWECKVLDRKTGQFKLQFPIPRNANLFLVDDQLVVTSKRYGYSVQLIDFETGKLIREIKPLGWIVHLLISLMVAYGVWIVAWMIISAHEGSWAWFDVMLVIGLPALLMIIRTALSGQVADLTRPTTRYALASVIAAEMLAVIWIVFGKTRFSLRIVPLLVLNACHMLWLTAVFHERPWIVWHATKCALVPAICLLPALAVLRRFGWRLHQRVAGEESEVDQSFGWSKFPLRDLVLITVVAALVFAAVRPVLDAIGEFVYVNTDLFLPLGVAIVCGLTAAILGLNQRRGLFWIGVSLALVGIGYLFWAPVSLFIEGNYSTQQLDPYLIDTCFGAGVALLIALVPYRLRGWILARGNSSSPSLAE